MFLTGESLASVPGLIGSNFSEKDLYAMTIIDYSATPESPTINEDTETPRPHTLEPHPLEPHPLEPADQIRSQEPASNEEHFNPFLRFIITECEWKIQNSEGVQNVTAATIGLHNGSITVGNLSIHNSEGNQVGVAVKLCVDDVTGVEGDETDNRQK